MAIASGRARPEIAHANVHNKWPKMQQGNQTIAQGGQNQKNIVLRPLPHFHHYNFPFLQIARSDHKVLVYLIVRKLVPGTNVNM